jgi:hypothetical protein
LQTTKRSGSLTGPRILAVAARGAAVWRYAAVFSMISLTTSRRSLLAS